jgi:hypothetical protein
VWSLRAQPEGKKNVWNITKKERYDLVVGWRLIVHSGRGWNIMTIDTEFLINWDGKWDMFFDEDLEAAKTAIDKELENGSK